MPDLNFILAVAGFAFVLAGFVKGVLGQGLPTVAIGLLSLIMSPGEARGADRHPGAAHQHLAGLVRPFAVPLIRRLWPTLLASFIGTFVATALGLGLLTPGGRGAGPQGARHRADPLRHARRLAHPPAGAAAHRALARPR